MSEAERRLAGSVALDPAASERWTNRWYNNCFTPSKSAPERADLYVSVWRLAEEQPFLHRTPLIRLQRSNASGYSCTLSRVVLHRETLPVRARDCTYRDEKTR